MAARARSRRPRPRRPARPRQLRSPRPRPARRARPFRHARSCWVTAAPPLVAARVSRISQITPSSA
ncbi:MAG: hypothetical protein E6J57_02755 [Deltaproteobacteria bacterium]|nr:MAG: hypothetical protein E6J57_02755 [Deltaproteobacteria bacterium]